MPGHFPADLLLVLLFFGTLGVFAHLVFRLFRVLRLGKKEDRFDRFDERIESVLVFVFGQKRVLSEPSGPKHLLIFWGFIFITLGTLESFARGVYEPFSYKLMLESITVPLGWLYGPFSLSQDFFGLALLAAAGAALYRRLVARPSRLDTDDPVAGRDASVILVLVSLVVLFAFVTGGLEMNRFAEVPRAWAPLSAMIAVVFSDTLMASQDLIRAIFWWAQVLAFLALLLYIPWSSLHRVRTVQGTPPRNPNGRNAEPDP